MTELRIILGKLEEDGKYSLTVKVEQYHSKNDEMPSWHPVNEPCVFTIPTRAIARVRDSDAGNGRVRRTRDLGKNDGTSSKRGCERACKNKSDRKAESKRIVREMDFIMTQSAEHALGLTSKPTPVREKRNAAGLASVSKLEGEHAAATVSDGCDDRHGFMNEDDFVQISDEPETNGDLRKQHKHTPGVSLPSPVNDDTAILEKVELLSSMGFYLPPTIAYDLVKAMDGNVDLIVRALSSTRT